MKSPLLTRRALHLATRSECTSLRRCGLRHHPIQRQVWMVRRGRYQCPVTDVAKAGSRRGCHRRCGIRVRTAQLLLPRHHQWQYRRKLSAGIRLVQRPWQLGGVTHRHRRTTTMSSSPRTLAAILAVALTILSGSLGSVAKADSQSDLRVTVNWGTPGQTNNWTLQCHPVGGTHPNRTRACAFLDGLAAPFAPQASEVVCSMIYSGPEQARVSGRWKGKLVDTKFARNDSCATARWWQYRALFNDPTTVAIHGRVDLGPTCAVQRLGDVCEQIGAQAIVTATSGSRLRKAQSGADGFMLLLPRAVWAVTADAGMSCPTLRIDTRVARVQRLLVIACDTGIRTVTR